MKLLLLTLLFLSLFARDSLSFDYFLLVHRLSDSEQSNQQDQTPWVIHGLWPENNDNTWPAYCHNQVFNRTIIAPLVPILEVCWPRFSDQKNKYALWQHEYMKHGTCSFGEFITSQFDYFNNTIELYYKTDLNGILSRAGLDQNSPAEKLIEAIRDAVKVTPHLNYVRDALHEIVICLDKRASYIDCRMPPGSIFHNTILLLPNRHVTCSQK